jgi:hypothetical protein
MDRQILSAMLISRRGDDFGDQPMSFRIQSIGDRFDNQVSLATWSSPR